jgi:hypothetical protein
MAGFDYTRVLDAIVSVLDAENTSTSNVYLSMSMSTAVHDVHDNDPETVNLAHLKLPAVFVRIAGRQSDFASLGLTGPTGNRRECDVDFEVVGVVKKTGILNTQQNLLRDVYKLAQNIEAVIEKHQTLSGTALWCNPADTQFSVPVGDQSTVMKACMVKVRSHHLYR